MRINRIMLAAAAVMTLSGCSTDEIANVETSGQNEIGFNVVGSRPGAGQANSPVLRANPITNTNITNGTGFDVFAFVSGEKGPGALFMGTHKSETEHEGVTFRYNMGTKTWDYDDKSEKAYWPVKPLDFFAIYPAIHQNIKFYSAACEDKKETIAYEVTDEFAKDAEDVNRDILYATAFSQTKETNGGTVQLQFHHALSQVVFKARTEQPGMEVKVGEVKIHNIKKSGKFTLPEQHESENDKATAANWTLDELESANSFHVYEHTSDITVSSDTKPVWISNVNETDPDQSRVTILLPQNIEKWVTTPENPVTIATADQNKRCYLSVQCNIKQKGQTVFCNAGQDGKLGTQDDVQDGLGTMYIPLEVNWNPGTRYIYTLVFGGGFDADGKLILTPISVTPTVEEWGDYNVPN